MNLLEFDTRRRKREKEYRVREKLKRVYVRRTSSSVRCCLVFVKSEKSLSEIDSGVHPSGFMVNHRWIWVACKFTFEHSDHDLMINIRPF